MIVAQKVFTVLAVMVMYVAIVLVFIDVANDVSALLYITNWTCLLFTVYMTALVLVGHREPSTFRSMFRLLVVPMTFIVTAGYWIGIAVVGDMPSTDWGSILGSAIKHGCVAVFGVFDLLGLFSSKNKRVYAWLDEVNMAGSICFAGVVYLLYFVWTVAWLARGVVFVYRAEAAYVFGSTIHPVIQALVL